VHDGTLQVKGGRTEDRARLRRSCND
jgi:hypothetical protein